MPITENDGARHERAGNSAEEYVEIEQVESEQGFGLLRFHLTSRKGLGNK